MNEDERGITPANVTSMTLERRGPGWQVIIEQGNGDVIKILELTDFERWQLGAMLDQRIDSITFVDFWRDTGLPAGGWQR